jgi:hypothetical protein
MRLLLLFLASLILCACKTERSEELLHLIESKPYKGQFHGGVFYQEGLKDSIFIPVEHQLGSLEGFNSDYAVPLASLSKLIVEVGILKLAEKGKIKLESKLLTYLPKCRAKYAGALKIIDLLQMKSGLPRELKSKGTVHPEFDENFKAQSFMEQDFGLDLLFEPGTKESYSNLAYWYLGAVIENLIGKNLHDALKELVLDPMGMENSGWLGDDQVEMNAHYHYDNRWKEMPSGYLNRYASGGLYASMKDMKAFAKNLANGFLSETSLEVLTKGQGQITVYGSLPSVSHVYFQDFESEQVFIFLNSIGIRDLELVNHFMVDFNQLAHISNKRPKRKVTLQALSDLNDSIPMEAFLKQFSEIILEEDSEQIYSCLSRFAEDEALIKEDPTWAAMADLKHRFPEMVVRGYRWSLEEEPKGIELWLTGEEARITFRFVVSEKQQFQFEGLFIMPDDMTWQGSNY